MQTIHYQQLTEQLPKLMETISHNHEAICLEMPNLARAVILSEEDYNSIMETLYLLSNPVNAEKLLTAVKRSGEEATCWEAVKNELAR
jgi:antitoxin YefM